MKRYFSRCILSILLVSCFSTQVGRTSGRQALTLKEGVVSSFDIEEEKEGQRPSLQEGVLSSFDIEEKKKQQRPSLQEGVLSSFDIEEGKKEQRWNIRGEGTITWPAMSDLDNYISWINNTWNGTVSRRTASYGFSGGVTYMIDNNLGVGIDYETLSCNASGTTMGGANNLDLRTSMEGVSGIFLIKYPEVMKNLSVTGEFGIGYYEGEYAETENGWSLRGDDSSVGCRMAARLEYCFDENLSFTLNGGYRFLEFDDFGINFVSPGNPPVELDYSGWFMGIGILYRW